MLRLRKKAAAKFDNADEMLFTEEVLQQATSQVVAEYRARAFAGGTVIDGRSPAESVAIRLQSQKSALK